MNFSNRKIDEFAGASNFVWFFGVVEDRKDPLNTGRVRVRCYGWHTDNRSELPTSSLPWAQVMMPANSASISGIGISPTGLVEGTTVIGFFLDGMNAQIPMVLGSIPGISVQSSSENDKGFTDPNRKYPLETGYPDTPKLSYDRFKEDEVYKARANTISGIASAGGEIWTEPSYRETESKYPYAHVHKTESGHTFEVDDTPGSERIHRFHKSGSYDEFRPDGSRVTKIIGDDYELVISNKKVYVRGTCSITIDGDSSLYVKGSLIEKIDGDHTMIIGGTQTITAQVTNIQNDVNITGTSTATEDHIAGEISLKKHIHVDSFGLGAGNTTPPKKA